MGLVPPLPPSPTARPAPCHGVDNMLLLQLKSIAPRGPNMRLGALSWRTAHSLCRSLLVCLLSDSLRSLCFALAAAQRNHCRAGAQGSLKLRETIVTFETDSEGTVALHLSPFEPLLTSVDYHGTARVYSCAAASPSARPVNSFQLAPGEVPAASDAHPPPGPATSGDLPAVPATIDVSHTFHLNELHGAGLLGVGALDGSVRVWRAHTRRGHQSMVAAWQAVPRPPVLEGHQVASSPPPPPSPHAGFSPSTPHIIASHALV